MRLAPLYEQECEQAFQQGQQRGEAIGLQKGEVIGLQKEALKLILRQLNRRFNDIPSNIIERINQLSVEQLEDLGESLLDFDTQDDLITWLNGQS